MTCQGGQWIYSGIVLYAALFWGVNTILHLMFVTPSRQMQLDDGLHKWHKKEKHYSRVHVSTKSWSDPSNQNTVVPMSSNLGGMLVLPYGTPLKIEYSVFGATTYCKCRPQCPSVLRVLVIPAFLMTKIKCLNPFTDRGSDCRQTFQCKEIFTSAISNIAGIANF